MVHADRGIQAVIGVVLCFSLLWTVAILVPDDRGRGVVRVRSNGIKRNRSQVIIADSNQFGLANEGSSVYVGNKGSQSSIRYGNKGQARVSITIHARICCCESSRPISLPFPSLNVCRVETFG